MSKTNSPRKRNRLSRRTARAEPLETRCMMTAVGLTTVDLPTPVSDNMLLPAIQKIHGSVQVAGPAGGASDNEFLRGVASSDTFVSRTNRLADPQSDGILFGGAGTALLIVNNGDGSDFRIANDGDGSSSVLREEAVDAFFAFDPAFTGGIMDRAETSNGLLGNRGNDFLEGGSGNDFLEGGEGYDSLHDQRSNVIIGSVGLNGLISLDLDGGEGNDFSRQNEAAVNNPAEKA